MELKEIKFKLEKAVPAFVAKVQPIYKLLNWEWSPGKSEPHVPSVGELENALYGLIEALNPSGHNEINIVSIGGLSAYYCMPEEGETGYYGLTFELEDKVFFN